MKIKIIYDLIFFAREKYGGISRMWHEIFKLLPKTNFKITFISGTANNMVQDYLEKNNFFGHDTIVESSNKLEKKFRIFSFYRSFKIYFILAKKKYSEGYIFHSTDYINPIIKPKNIKIITTIHDMVFWDQSEKFKITIDYLDRKFAITNSIRVSDKIITVSNTSKKAIIKQFPKAINKIEVIYHGLNKDFLNIKFCKIKRKSFLFLGSRNNYKNLDLLLEAFSIFIKNKPDWTLELIGENSHSNSKEKILYKRLGIQENVKDYGFVNNSKIINILQTTGAIIIPSFNEGFNFPLLEGLASGAPVLSSNIPVSIELGKQFVKYFSPNSVDELLGLMNNLDQDNLDTNLLINGQAYAQTFTWKNSFDKLSNLYSEV